MPMVLAAAGLCAPISAPELRSVWGWLPAGLAGASRSEQQE
jgi:hypothetical protein